jgi:hypothetical protein
MDQSNKNFFDNIYHKIIILNNLNFAIQEAQRLKFELRFTLFLIFDVLTKTSEIIKLEILNYFKKYPDIYSYVASASENPTCDCRKKVIIYFENNLLEITNFFKELLEKFPQEESFYTDISSKITNLTGRYDKELNNINKY